MSGLPSATIEMAPPDGSAWYDITSYVPLDNGVRCSRGRASEFDATAPGSMEFTLSNRTGFWAPGSFFSPVGYGVLAKNAQVRLTIGATQVWQGRVDSFDWEPGEATVESYLVVKCTDECKSYARTILAPWAVETCKADVAWTGGAVYPLAPANAIGSYWAAHRDLTADAMRVYGGSAGHHEFSDDGPPFVGSCIKLVPWGQIAPVIEHPTTWNPASEYGLVSFWFRTSADETSYLFNMERSSGGSGYFSIFINAVTGRLTFAAAGDSGGSVTVTPSGTGNDDLFDGAWHHVAAWLHPKTGGTELRYYIDGTLKTTVYSATAITIGSGNRRAVFGGNRNSAWTDNVASLNGEIACPAIWTYSSTTDAPSYWYDDGMLGGPGSQTIANQLTDLAGFVGAATPGTANLTGYQIAGQDTKGRSLLECYQQLAESELGVFYVDRLGAPRLRGYNARTSGSLTLTVSARADLDGDLKLSLDDSTYANTVQATSTSGSALAYDSTLVAADGLAIVDEWSALTETEADLATMADNRLGMRKHSTPRLSKVVVDLLTAQNAIESTTLQLVPLDRVRVSELDSTMFGATTYDGFVEGWELEIDLETYRVSLDLSPVI